ncbi:hypothetical protein [Vulcanisaeta sp. JCM 14467]|nr:hypothetical protein [Vulcanisaeta sp. JCM 14467]
MIKGRLQLDEVPLLIYLTTLVSNYLIVSTCTITLVLTRYWRS